MRRLPGLLAAALVAVLSAARADAELLTYEFTGTLSGTLGVDAFVDAPVRFSLTADTAGITSTGGEPGSVPFRQTYTTPAATLEFAIDGVEGTFADPFRVFALTFAPSGLPGPMIGTIGLTPEGPNNGNDLLDVRGVPLALYDLAAPFGPFAQSPPDFLNPGEPYPTSAGDLVLDESDADRLAFQAFAAVPEPSSAALAGVGALALVAYARRRRRRPA